MPCFFNAVKSQSCAIAQQQPRQETKSYRIRKNSVPPSICPSKKVWGPARGGTDKQMDEQTEFLPILQDFIPCWGRLFATLWDISILKKQGKGTADLMPFGDWFVMSRNPIRVCPFIRPLVRQPVSLSITSFFWWAETKTANGLSRVSGLVSFWLEKQFKEAPPAADTNVRLSICPSRINLQMHLATAITDMQYWIELKHEISKIAVLSVPAEQKYYQRTNGPTNKTMDGQTLLQSCGSKPKMKLTQKRQ